MSTSHTHISPVRSTTFDEAVAATDLPVVVDFTARWCPPCGPTADALDVVAGEHPDRFVALSVDVDDEQELTRRFGVTSMPTLLVLDGGEVVQRLVGGRGPARLREDLAELLGVRAAS